MSADVVPFPLARRRDLIQRQAAWFCDQGERAAESNLWRLLQVQRDALLRRGVDPPVVEREVQALEAAIRAAATRLVYAPRPGGGAA
jgi:hypothetical protein